MHTRKPPPVPLLACVLACALAIAALTLAGAALAATDFDRLLGTLTQRFGTAPVSKFNAWRALLASSSALPEGERLKRVNDFFNRHVRFEEDIDNWGQADYWATPMESLGQGAGDCEDYAIAKYFSLREVGIAPARLRLVYVRATTGTGEGATSQAHMVLAYYPQPDADPLVLDNLVGDIRAASRRPDLVPIFSFNSEGVFTGASQGGKPTAGTGRLSRWEDLLKRARAEGFDWAPN